MEEFSDAAYAAMIERLFIRFPSFQKVGGQAYKPGIDNMLFFDQLAGHPHRRFASVHIAGTNGKGSVSNMLASVLSASGLRTGLYTSPHILDFRERMRILDGRSGAVRAECISRREVWDFVNRWGSTSDHLDLSFFEITTMMALDWFASRDVDAAVIETGLGGRLDSTNIISPVLSVITNIGLDHCDMLGGTLGEIAFEKAGIIKPRTPAVIGESDPETDPVFERKVLYTNLPDPEYMGDRKKIMSLLHFADRSEPVLWPLKERLLAEMDLQGIYQEKNLRTALTALDVLVSDTSSAIFAPLAQLFRSSAGPGNGHDVIAGALIHTASRMDFHGRWEMISRKPPVIADIGHNAHGLKYNFAQLGQYLDRGTYTHLIIVYGSAADKDISAIFPLMPREAEYIFTNASGKRALPAGVLLERYLTFCSSSGIEPPLAESTGCVKDALSRAFERYAGIIEENPGARPLIYVGGSTYVVAEAAEYVRK